MAHFAELDDNNVVINRVVVNNEDMLDENGQESEAVGIAFLHHHLGSGRTWVQCSYNNNIRGQYPYCDGFIYDPVKDVFVLPDPKEN